MTFKRKLQNAIQRDALRFERLARTSALLRKLHKIERIARREMRS